MTTIKPSGYVVVDALGNDEEEPSFIGPFPTKPAADAWCKQNMDPDDPFGGFGIFEVERLYSPVDYAEMLTKHGA